MDTTDFYALADDLPAEDHDLLHRLREFLDNEVAPIANWHWSRERFPHHLIEPLGKLDVGGLSYRGHGLPGRTSLLHAFVTLHLPRTDPSFATFFGVHTGLAMGSIYLCGSEEQKAEWLPPMHRFEKIGAFGLTEPDVGSAASRGLKTTARREGDDWVLDGEKKWIGNATFADVVVIWAKDVEDGQVKGFLVEKDTPGFTPTKIEGKIALRTVQNAHILLENCRVPEANRLQHEVGRFVADAEPIHSYEGTREMNTLIVGRAITGQSAFV